MCFWQDRMVFDEKDVNTASMNCVQQKNRVDGFGLLTSPCSHVLLALSSFMASLGSQSARRLINLCASAAKLAMRTGFNSLAARIARYMIDGKLSVFSLRRDQAGSLLTFTKGIAILPIFFHHFARSTWLARGMAPPALLQWNFTSAGMVFGALTSSAGAGRYYEVFLRLMARYGYMGVHLFVLASGLGLALGTPMAVSTGAFLKHRMIRIIPPFWMAVALLDLWETALGHPFAIRDVVERLFLLTTFDEKRFFNADSPLWYLSLAFQLYLIFLPLRRLIVRFGLVSLLPLAAIGFVARQLAALPAIMEWNQYFGHVLALNWLAVFGLGIWIGDRLRRDGEVALPGWAVTATALASFSLFLLSNAWKAAYPIHDTVIGVLIAVVAFLAWRMMDGTYPARAVAAVGAISFPLYLYHRPVVSKLLNLWCRRIDPGALPPAGLGLALAVVLIVFLLLARRALRVTPKIRALVLGV